MKTELVTTLKRKATDLIADIKKNHNFMMITEKGKPAAYLVDIKYFEVLQRRMLLTERLLQSEIELSQGKVKTHAQAKEQLSKWLK